MFIKNIEHSLTVKFYFQIKEHFIKLCQNIIFTEVRFFEILLLWKLYSWF